MRHLTLSSFAILFMVSGLLFFPKMGRADCTCVNLNFTYNTEGAYDGPPLSFNAGCNAARSNADSNFSAYAAGTCNSLGMFGGTCQVSTSVNYPCFAVGPTDYFILLHYEFHCLSCGL